MPRPAPEMANKGGREEGKPETDLASKSRQFRENQEKRWQKIREGEYYKNLVDRYKALRADDTSEFHSLDEFFRILNDTLSTFKRQDPLRKPTELFLEDHKEEWLAAAKPGEKLVSLRRKKEAGAAALGISKTPEEPLYPPEEVRRLIREWFPVLAVRDAGYAGGDRTRRVSNLDGNSCLFLFRKILGFDQGTEEEKKYVFDKVKYVPAGRVAEGALNLDTSDHVEGGLAEKGMGFVDHHGPESPRQSSAFKILYQYFQEAGYLAELTADERSVLERMAEFVTYIDSYSLPKKGENGLTFSPRWSEAWRDSDRTLFGISLIYQNEIPVEEIFEFFKKYSLAEALTKDIYAIKDINLEKIRKLGNRFLKEDKINTEKFVVNERNPKRRVFDSPFFGRILAGVQERGDARVVGLQFAALARGFDGSLLYRPDNNSFALSVGQHKTIPPELAGKIQGAEWIRGGMIVKPPSKEIPAPNLNDLIKLLSGEEPEPVRVKAGKPTVAEEQPPQLEAANPAFAIGEEVMVRPGIPGVDALSGVPKKIINSINNVGINYYQLEGVERRYREEWLMNAEAPGKAGSKEAAPPSEGAKRKTSASEATPSAPTAVAIEAPITTPETIEKELKQKVAVAKQEFEIKRAEWEKYQGLLGFFRGRGKSKEDKSAIQQEYEDAKEKYARGKAELAAFKAFNYLKQESQLTEGFGRVIAKTLERKRGGAAREWAEKIYAGYKKLGELNLARGFKIEDKLAAWQPTGKLGKTGKILANIGSRYLSVRTALSLGLLGAGFWVGTGVTLATGIFAARRGLVTFGGFFGVNEVWKGIEKTKLLKEISQDKLKKMSDAELVARLREIEVYNLMEGKEEFGGYGYDQLRKELEERLSQPADGAEVAEGAAGASAPERTTLETERPPAPGERSVAETKAGERGERAERALKDLLEDVNGQLKAVEAKFKKRRTARLATATLTAGLFGSGLYGEAYGWLLKKGMGLVGLGAEVPVGDGGAGAGAAAEVKGAGVASAESAGARNLAGELQEQMKALGQEARAHGQKFLDSLEAMKKEASAVLRQTLEAGHMQDLSTLHKGEGVISVFSRQMEAFPEKFGFTGDIHNASSLHQWAEHQAANVAIKQGYWNPTTGEQNWVRWNPKAPMHYVLEGDANHGFKVSEAGTEGRHFIHQPTEGEKMVMNEQRVKLPWKQFDEEWNNETAGVAGNHGAGHAAQVERISQVGQTENGPQIEKAVERGGHSARAVEQARRVQEAVSKAVVRVTESAPVEAPVTNSGGVLGISSQELKAPAAGFGPANGFIKLGLVGGRPLEVPDAYGWKDAASIHASMIDEKIKVANELVKQYENQPGLSKSAADILAVAKKDAIDFAAQVHAGKSLNGYDILKPGKTLGQYHGQVLREMRRELFQRAAMSGTVVESTVPAVLSPAPPEISAAPPQVEPVSELPSKASLQEPLSHVEPSSEILSATEYNGHLNVENKLGGSIVGDYKISTGPRGLIKIEGNPQMERFKPRIFLEEKSWEKVSNEFLEGTRNGNFSSFQSRAFSNITKIYQNYIIADNMPSDSPLKQRVIDLVESQAKKFTRDFGPILDQSKLPKLNGL